MSDYRLSQVEKIVQEVTTAGTAGRTRAELAAALGIRKSQHLYGLIDDAINTGRIRAMQPKNQHNRTLFVYVGV
jgi:hypothetical protein